MTTPPWCREKVIVYFLFLLFNITTLSLFSGMEESSSVYRRNNNGPKILPCSTPFTTLANLLVQPSNVTDCDRFDRYCQYRQQRTKNKMVKNGINRVTNLCDTGIFSKLGVLELHLHIAQHKSNQYSQDSNQLPFLLCLCILQEPCL